MERQNALSGIYGAPNAFARRKKKGKNTFPVEPLGTNAEYRKANRTVNFFPDRVRAGIFMYSIVKVRSACEQVVKTH